MNKVEVSPDRKLFLTFQEGSKLAHVFNIDNFLGNLSFDDQAD